MLSEKKAPHRQGEVHYKTLGKGKPVVFVHGFGETGGVWKNQYDACAGYRLIIPDLPGTGKSPLTSDMSMEGLADAVHSIVLHEIESAEKIIMIGHSMGGYITLAYAEKYADRLDGFGLFHSTAFADSEEKKQTRKKGISFIREHGSVEFLRTTIPNLYGPYFKKDKPRMVEQHINDSGVFTPEALVTYYESMMQRPDRTGILQEAKCPVLFIFGRHDTAVPIDDGLKQSHLPNVSYVHILENSGHMGMIEESETSNDILNRYFADLKHP
jgi:pimeloyl-ACP methyl ester carboxylesterase